MTLERIWAGWRAAYLGAAGDDPGCVLCRVLAEAAYVVWRSEHCAAVLNAYPYTVGHLLVLPARHVSDLEDVDGEEAAEMWAVVRDAVLALKAAYRPGGVNVGLNLGRAAGAGVPAHLHVHVLPRWDGDTNFMTTVAEARVLPEALPATLERLRAAWPSGTVGE